MAKKFNTTLQASVRKALDRHVKESGVKIQYVVNAALTEYLEKHGQRAA